MKKMRHLLTVILSLSMVMSFALTAYGGAESINDGKAANSAAATRAMAAAPNLMESADGNYEYTANGSLEYYYGDEFFVAPAEIDGTLITRVGDKLCFDLGIYQAYIEDGITEIGTSAFEGSGVIFAYIAETVKTIDSRAFANCQDLFEVCLYSDNIRFGKDAFKGTGYIDFYLPCTADLNAMKKKIAAAKGDDNFGIEQMHMSLVESMDEKDIFGENMIYCEDCGFKGSRYLEDVHLPFMDVSEDAWYYAYVALAYDCGIINGKSETVFDPNAGMTCAEAAKIAAVIHRSLSDEYETMEFQPTGPNWYDTYVDYCYDNGIIARNVKFNWKANATRAEMAYLFSRCDTDPAYLNEVPLTDIPDVNEGTKYYREILDLYNKGVAVGSDQYYTYYPNSNVKRSEAAALIARIITPDLRIELAKG